MSMGYAANSILTISYMKVEKVVGSKLYKKFADALEECAISESAISESELFQCDFDLDSYEFDDETKEQEIRASVTKVMDLYNEIIKVFKKSTKMVISRGYHDAEDQGDCYDDVSGGYWEVDFSSVFTKTKKANDFEDTFGSIDTTNFVTFG